MPIRLFEAGDGTGEIGSRVDRERAIATGGFDEAVGGEVRKLCNVLGRVHVEGV